MNRKRGFTLIELLVVIAIIALLIGLLLPALAKAQKNARTLKDKTQIKQIHQAMLVFAEDNDGKLPTPGLIDRLQDVYTGQEMPGRGAEDIEQNNTAQLYSCMIAQELINTAIVVGPTEVSPYIEEDPDYDFDMYDPTSDTYWDPNFTADITTPLAAGGGGGSNASYSHMALCGKRKELKWVDIASNGDPIMSTRGVRDGVFSGQEYTASPTLQLHGPDDLWDGNIVFADNHVEYIDNFYPASTSYWATTATASTKDNIFDAEFDDYGDPMASNDAFLVMTEGPVTATTVTPIWDPLEF